MKSSLLLHMASLMAALGDMNYKGEHGSHYIDIKKDDSDRLAALKATESKRNKEHGLKEFFYGEQSLWAINKIVADKKALKKGWLK
jgi:hypothetical protein